MAGLTKFPTKSPNAQPTAAKAAPLTLDTNIFCPENPPLMPPAIAPDRTISKVAMLEADIANALPIAPASTGAKK